MSGGDDEEGDKSASRLLELFSPSEQGILGATSQGSRLTDRSLRTLVQEFVGQANSIHRISPLLIRLPEITLTSPTPHQRQSPLGLGDLLQVVVTLGLGEEEARIAAIAMGLRPPSRPQTATLRGPESRDRPKRPLPTTTIEARPAAEPSPEPLTPPPGTGLILERADADTEELPAFLQGVSALGEEAFSEKSVPLRLPSLFEPAWVRGLIVTLLSTETKDGAVDIARLVVLVSEGRAVTKLPQLGRFSLRRGAQVLVDESADMMPFSTDATQICATIRALAAGAPVMIVRSESGCPALGRGPGDSQSRATALEDGQAPSMVIHDDGEERAYRMPMRGVPIVAVTDLGLRSPDRAAEWLRFAVGARRAGCPLIALTPYPKSRWPRSLAKRIAIVPWDRSTRVSAVRREARGASRPFS